MSRAQLSFGPWLTFVLVGCSSVVRPDEGRTDVTVPAPRPDPTAHASSESVASVRVAPEAPPSFSLPEPTSAPLGASCAAGAAKEARGNFGTATFDTCGERARVSIEVARPSALRRAREPGSAPLPCTPAPLGQPVLFDVRACVAGDELLAESICVACRALDSGTVVHARIDELTKEQASALYQGLQGDGEAPTSPAAWQAAIARMRRAR